MHTSVQVGKKRVAYLLKMVFQEIVSWKQGSWELNLDLVEEQPMLLIIKPFL